VQVVYENNLDDLIALNTDLLSNNIQFKKIRLWRLYASPLFLLFSFSFFAYVTNHPSFYWGAVAGALLSFFLTFYAYKNYPKKAAKQTEQKEVLCQHIITVTAGGVRENTENSEGYHKWQAINNVSINDDYVFIYTTGVTAHVIPKRVLGENYFIKFKQQVRVYYQHEAATA